MLVLLLFVIPHPPSALDRRFAGVVNQIYQAIGASQFYGRLAGPIILLISGRLRRLRARFFALFARVAAGKPRTGPRKPQKPRPEGEPTPPHTWTRCPAPSAGWCASCRRRGAHRVCSNT